MLKFGRRQFCTEQSSTKVQTGSILSNDFVDARIGVGVGLGGGAGTGTENTFVKMIEKLFLTMLISNFFSNSRHRNYMIIICKFKFN